MRLQPLKRHGGKYYMSDKLWKIARSVPHVHRVEEYGGALSFTLAANPKGYSEVVNDLDGELINFWRVLQDVDQFGQMQRILMAMPFSQVQYQLAQRRTDQLKAAWGRQIPRRIRPVERACDFFVICRQSMAGRMKSFCPLSKTRTRRGVNEQASAWIGSIDDLLPVHDRLRPVVILHDKAMKVFKQQDGKRTLHYLDPTYFPDTRTAPDVYEFEMTIEEHEDMLDTVNQAQGKVILSGYDCKLYRRELKRWRRWEFDLPNNAASGASKRRMQEVVWCNF